MNFPEALLSEDFTSNKQVLNQMFLFHNNTLQIQKASWKVKLKDSKWLKELMQKLKHSKLEFCKKNLALLNSILTKICSDTMFTYTDFIFMASVVVILVF